MPPPWGIRLLGVDGAAVRVCVCVCVCVFVFQVAWACSCLFFVCDFNVFFLSLIFYDFL